MIENILYKAFDIFLLVANGYIAWLMRRVQMERRTLEEQKKLNEEQSELIAIMQKEVHILKTQAHACSIRQHHLKEQIIQQNR